MKMATVSFLVERIIDFGACEVGVRMNDGHILSYFYKTDKHVYHRGLQTIEVDVERDLLVAESSYGLGGNDSIVDFIDVRDISMISIMEPNVREAATL